MKKIDLNPEAVAEIVEVELKRFSNSVIRETLTALLIKPRLQIRTWEYSSRDGQPETLPCWIIADLRQRDTGLAYSLSGHGAHGNPWGIVFLSDTFFGADDSWYPTLEAVAVDSGYVDSSSEE